MADKTISLVGRKQADEKRQQREKKIDRLIQSKLTFKKPFPPFTLPEYEVERLLKASYEEKETFYRAEGRRMKLILLTIAILWAGFTLYRQFVPAPVRPEPPKPTFEAAGVIQDIQLQSTTFSTDTTVKTTTGIFQVHGGVSATTGDTAQIKREGEGSFLKSALCIESKIKPQCYPIL
ncbi:MAG: hypothetical protein FD131_3524 [Rhodocyclaceae bacterium]|nr:MAG: hypothetical protein FD131_3524 [Rhodocyclaceae bacterium]